MYGAMQPAGSVHRHSYAGMPAELFALVVYVPPYGTVAFTPSRPRPPALFFVSGAAGLVYQVAWSRLLDEIFGVTAYAVTAVLAPTGQRRLH
jgi:hypothetical protein